MTKHESVLTQKRLLEVLRYEPETGYFYWNGKQARNTLADAKAGGLSNHGYWVIVVDKKRYMAHRLAWLYVHGKWPENFIDHIDGVKTNNKISNLRNVTAQGNRENQHVSTGEIGILGVYKRSSRFVAQITSGSRTRYLGTFDTPEAAHLAYVSEKRNIHKMGTL